MNFLFNTLDPNFLDMMIVPKVVEIRKNKKMFDSVIVDIKSIQCGQSNHNEIYALWANHMGECGYDEDAIDEIWENECDDITNEYFTICHFEYFDQFNIGKLWSPVN